MPLPAPRYEKFNRWVIWTVGIMLVVPMFYWFYTAQVWEDFLITFRASHNLASGLGLTYEAGTRVYCFTSPLNALLPAFFDWLTKTDSYAVPLGCYNVVALAAYAWGGLLTLRLMTEEDGKVGAAAAVFPLLLVLCHRTTAFVVNGQEAGFWIAFLAASFYCVVRGHDRCWIGAGLSWSGLMWTRPDSFVHIALFACVALAAPARARRAEAMGLLRAAGICAIGYLPWLVGTWWYYGSPIPHSLQAKIGAYVGAGLPWQPIPAVVRLRDVFGGMFAPIYGLNDHGWDRLWLWSAAFLGGIAALAWAFPQSSRMTRCASACLAGSLVYLGIIWSHGTAFPWYFVPAGFFGSLVLARLPFDGNGRLFGRVIAASIPLVVAGQFFISATRLSAAQQRIVEEGVRKPIGLWLRAQMRPGEHVFLEPIGYIGYFSGASVFDYPGLVSPDVLRLRRSGLKFYDLIDSLAPAWLVLRDSEYAGFLRHPQLASQYRLAVVFDECSALANAPPVRGASFGGDSRFFVLVRADRPLPAGH